MPDDPIAQPPPARLPAEVDTSVPHPARMYDYGLGGSHNFAADREAAERARAAMPGAFDAARGNRDYLGRAVRFCVSEGIDQFLDLGSGIPTVGNVHAVAQAVAQAARVAYVDNEAVAVEMSRAVLADVPGTSVTSADLRDVDAVLHGPGVRDLLDLSRPVALLTVAVMHFVPEPERHVAYLDRYRSALAPGSVHVLSHVTADIAPEEMGRIADIYRSAGGMFTLRSRDEVAALMAGTEVVEPGIVEVRDWRPEPDDLRERGRNFYGVVGRIR